MRTGTPAPDWLAGTAPSGGDTLVFPVSAAQRTTSNNNISSLSVAAVQFQGSGYTISGNAFTISGTTGAISDTNPAGTNTINLGGALTFSGVAALSQTAGGTLTISNAVTFNATTPTLNSGAGTIVFAGGISGTNMNIQTTAGKAILSGTTNIGSGTVTVASGGILNLQSSNALATSGAVTVNTGGQIQLQGSGVSINRAVTLNGTGINTTGALDNVSGANSWTGTISMGAATTIENDDVSNTLTLSPSANITAGYNLTFQGAGNISVTSPINTGAFTLTKASIAGQTASGTLTLTANNTYSGATNINAGTVVLSGASGAALSSAFSVNTGGTLLLDNSVNNIARLGSAVALTLNGGTFNFLGQGVSASTQSIGALTLGANTYSTVTGSGGGTVTFASISRGTQATVNFATADATTNKVIITAAPTARPRPRTKFYLTP